MPAGVISAAGFVFSGRRTAWLFREIWDFEIPGSNPGAQTITGAWYSGCARVSKTREGRSIRPAPATHALFHL